MNDKKVSSLQNILKKILKNDINLLNSRNELIDKVKAQISGNDIREFSAIQKALQNNVGELFLKATLENTPEAKEEAKTKVSEILHQQNVQEKRIQMVIDTFVYALEWNKSKKEETKPISIENLIEPPKIENTPVVPVHQNIIKPKIVKSIIKEPVSTIDDTTWYCSCNTMNNTLFCTKCNKICPSNILEKLANQGNAEAQYQLALYYKNRENNISKAISWMKKAVDNGYSNAELTEWIEKNKIIPEAKPTSSNKEEKETVPHIKSWTCSCGKNNNDIFCEKCGTSCPLFKLIAYANQGNTKAQYQLALYYMNTVNNREAAIFWMKKAVANGCNDQKLIEWQQLQNKNIVPKKQQHDKATISNDITDKPQKNNNNNNDGCGCLVAILAVIIAIFYFLPLKWAIIIIGAIFLILYWLGKSA